MLKTVLAGTTALAIAGTALAYAQPGDRGRTARKAGGRARKISLPSATHVSPR